MCGIFLAAGPAASLIELEPRLVESTLAVKHRGPDSDGFWSSDGVFLGHTRLSIIDLDERSDQPFELGDFIMVYNGEIFNYVELAAELRAEGVDFDLRSDSEVVLRAFAHWGKSCFSKFNGMWALCIYDKRDGSIVISRDRFGQKPMFYSRDGDFLYVSSEVHQLTKLVKATPNQEVIVSFLEEGDSVREPYTFFNEIYEFPSACFATVSLNGAMLVERYWDYPKTSITTDFLHDFSEFEDLFDDSVAIRTRGDVPLGILLSGGIDSTVVASSLVESYPGCAQDLKAICYQSSGVNDESKYALEVANDLGLSFFSAKEPSETRNVLSTLEKVIYNLGRGHSSTAIGPVDQLYSTAKREGLKVVLDGQGADELLAGYKLFYFELMVLLFKENKFSQLRKTFLAVLKQNKNFKLGVLEIVILHFRTKSPRWVRRLMRSIYGYGRFFDRKAKIPKVDLDDSVKDQEISADCNRNRLNRFLVTQHATGLRNLLFYGDIVAMNNSVENRSPFMDHRLIEFVFSRDEVLKVYDGVEKYALRRLRHYKNFENILDRNKVGFDSPLGEDVRDKMRNELLGSKLIDCYLFRPQLRSFLGSQNAVSDKYERFLFRLYQVYVWFNLFDMTIPEEKA